MVWGGFGGGVFEGVFEVEMYLKVSLVLYYMMGRWGLGLWQYKGEEEEEVGDGMGEVVGWGVKLFVLVGFFWGLWVVV